MLRLMSSMHKATRSWADEAEQGRRKKQFKNKSLARGDKVFLHTPGGPGSRPTLTGMSRFDQTSVRYRTDPRVAREYCVALVG